MKNEQPVIYVVDDDASLLKSMERLLRSAGYNVEAFSSAKDFLDFQFIDGLGCLVLDVRMPELDGLELQKRLTESGITLPIVFITGYGTIPMSVRAMKAGAVDFLQKPFLEDDLLDVVGGAVDASRQALAERNELKRLRERLKKLTPRETEVFALIVSGMLNKQVAFELGTSEKTIKVHRARILEKMGAGSLAELVRFAGKLGVSLPRH